MLTTIRQQMICIIAPGWRHGAEHPCQMQEPLDYLFTDVGIVHFASIALLPAMSDSRDGLPSLMLELVTEEGLRPYDLLERLVNHPRGAMWALFSSYWDEQPPEASQSNQKLLDRLMGWTHIADGGFVGARDRSVWQIGKENGLYEQTRQQARRLPPKCRENRASFALALSRWAIDRPNFEWATTPAPRSFWRGTGLGVKALYPIALVGVWLTFLGLVDGLSRLLAHACDWLFGGSNTAAHGLFRAVSAVGEYLICASGRLLLALAIAAFAFWVFFFALPALFAPWRRWIDRLFRELDRPTDTWSSLSTYVSVWIVGAPLFLAGLLSVLGYTFFSVHFRSVIAWSLPTGLGWEHFAIAAFAILALLAIGAVFSQLERLLPSVNDLFYAPHEDNVDRAQQVHRSIEECEAQLAAGTAHMISLTDMRDPHGWSAWWTRAALRLVTFVGRVYFTEGVLGGAPGIHFGHWHIIDNGRRFLFCSNYDGNFGGYLDDFINGASTGTTLFWRWTKLKAREPAAEDQPRVTEPRDFPPTRFLAFRGVKCELKFKAYARDSMLPHLYHFDACKLTIDQIDRATALRNALFSARNDSNDDQIMRAIES